MLNASPKILKHIAMVGAFAVTTWLGTAVAQDATPPSGTPTSGPAGSPTSGPGSVPDMSPTPSMQAPPGVHETDTMENYLTNHPRVADELHNNPSLINNPEWLSKHPEVQSWMNSHPNVRADAAAHPDQFVNHTERETLNRDRKEMNKTDAFLSKHPALANQLNKNPNLVDDPKFMADHPALQNYMNEHPGIAKEWKDHPEAFATAARADERYNRTGKVPPINHPRTSAKK